MSTYMFIAPFGSEDEGWAQAVFIGSPEDGWTCVHNPEGKTGHAVGDEHCSVKGWSGKYLHLDALYDSWPAVQDVATTIGVDEDAL